MKPAHLRAPRPGKPEVDPQVRVGLRLRLWLGCLAGGALAGAGVLWVLGTRVGPGPADPAALLAWLSGVAFLAVLAGVAFAAWLDHHVVGQLRILVRALRARRLSELRGLPAAGGWGELGDLAEEVHAAVRDLRAVGHATEEIELLRGQLAALQVAADRWVATETWEAPSITEGVLAELNDTLARGFSRRGVVDAQNREAAQQVAGELAAAIADAQESATQAERGFVEATAMLTTVRELQRLSAELQLALDALGAPATTPEQAAPGAAEASRVALEELVEASQSSVDAIGRAMLRVHEVSAQVQTLSNRATLVAIHAVAAPPREGDAPADERAAELKQLALDVRAITDRTTVFADDIDLAVGEAAETMAAARVRALQRLEAAVVTAPGAPVAGRERAYDDAQRLLERVREMVQDAARKGERLSAAGERTSRAAERLSRRVEAEASETEALRVRLNPVGESEPAAPGDAPRAAGLKLIPIEGDDAPARPSRSREEEGRP